MYFNYDYVLTNHANKNFGGKRSSTKYIIIHYTGNVKDTAENNAKYFFTGDRRAGANFFVDGKGVWASTPEDCTAYGAGVLHNKKYARLWGICTNHNAVNIEIACDAGNSLPTAEAVTNAVELTKSLMAKYGIPANNVVRHKDVCGKNCPAYWWDDAKWQSEFRARLSGNAAQNASPAPIPKPNVQPKPSGNENVKKAQHFANVFVDAGLEEDGKIGPKTKKAVIKVLQKCLNLNYKKNLVIDGIPGKHTYDALGDHYVKRGETQYLVTFVECALSALGYDVHGIETPGIFGSGLEYAVKKVQERRGLKADGVAGHDTLRSVISMLS